MSDTPPDWVLLEAAKRSKLSNDTPRQRAILFDTNPSFRTLCRAIEQHEAFKQEVSDAVEAFKNGNMHTMNDYILERFIIPKPKPDPLAEVLEEISGEGGFDNFDHYAYNLHAALEARGFEIREKGQ
jgi:hypothetical protein